MSTELSQALKEEFVTAKYLQVKDYLPFIAKDILLAGIREDLEDILSLADEDVCLKRAKFFDLNGVTVNDYKERVLELGPGRFAVLGVRFRGLRVEDCFVSAWPNFEISGHEEIEQLKDIVRREFAAFNPKWLSLFFRADKQWPGVSYQLDLVTVVGEVRELQKRAVSDDEIYLDQVHEVDFYDRYSQEYKKFHLEAPHLKFDVTKEVLADLEAAAEDSLLYKVMLNDQMIGVISGKRELRYGVNAVSIQEKLLFDGYRGRGYSQNFQTQFINQLDPEVDQIIWGTILAANTASLKSALATGRTPVEADFFFDL